MSSLASVTSFITSANQCLHVGVPCLIYSPEVLTLVLTSCRPLAYWRYTLKDSPIPLIELTPAADLLVLCYIQKDFCLPGQSGNPTVACQHCTSWTLMKFLLSPHFVINKYGAAIYLPCVKAIFYTISHLCNHWCVCFFSNFTCSLFAKIIFHFWSLLSLNYSRMSWQPDSTTIHKHPSLLLSV